MSYTISEVAKMMGVNPSTLRYYDKEELLPDVKRVNGIRIFEDEDFGWLRVLNCLKNTGMPIRKIKRYVELAKYGDETLEERYELIKEQRQSVLQQIEQLQYYLQELDYKDWYYQTASQDSLASLARRIRVCFSRQIPVRIRAHPRGAFNSVGACTPTELNTVPRKR